MQSIIIETPKAVTTIPAAEEPLNASEVKKHLELGSSTAHDTQLTWLIQAAREQFENDTGICIIERTQKLELPKLCEWQFVDRPVQSITSVTYYDSGNNSQTLGASLYVLNTARGQFLQAYQAIWPDTASRWDAVTITYEIGAYSDYTTVPGMYKQAMLLLIARDFYDREDMANKLMRRYDNIVNHLLRNYAG